MNSKKQAAGTKSIALSRQGALRREVGYHFIVELIEIARLALPMVMTQLGQVVMMTTDLAFIGRIGAEAVAAAALAGRVYVVSVAFGMGVVAASASCVAQAFGADNSNLVRRSLRMALWTALLLSLPIMTIQLHGEQILLALANRRARRGSRNNTCREWPGARRQCCHSWQSVVLCARSIGLCRSCGSRSRPSR